jgi:hypothetical protein
VWVATLGAATAGPAACSLVTSFDGFGGSLDAGAANMGDERPLAGDTSDTTQSHDAGEDTGSDAEDTGRDADGASPRDGPGMGNNSFYYQGSLYDARVYNRALTASEVQALYQGTACP